MTRYFLFDILNALFVTFRKGLDMSGNEMFHRILGSRVKVLRAERKLTLTGLAEKSGISKGSLSVLEDGRGNPTISTIWRLADALGIPFGELAKFDSASESLKVKNDGISVQLIEREEKDQLIESYLMKLGPNCSREAEPHPPGVFEKVSVLKGELITGGYNSPRKISAGENYTFPGDCVHIYKSNDSPVSVIVSVIYPKEQVHLDSFTKYISIANENDKDGIFDFINRNVIEVINGLKITRIIFNSRFDDLSEHIRACLKIIRSQDFFFPIHIFLRQRGSDTEVYLLPRFNSCKVMDFKLLEELYPVENKDEKCIDIPTSWLGSDSMTLSTLAAEAFFLSGTPTIPTYVKTVAFSKENFENCSGDRSFEDRINVANYNNFELLHPGYGRQAPEMARMIRSYHKKSPEEILDIGTGPGHPLLMLLEFFPGAKAVAVDPSEASCKCLLNNIKESKIHSIKEDFLNMEVYGEYPVITSVGASHHFNTAFFFQKAMKLLKSDGLLLVSDELLSPFSTQGERTLLLIRHHLMYMLDVMVNIPGSLLNGLKGDEVLLVELMEKELPVLAFEATTEMLEPAVRRARNLLQKISSLNLNEEGGDEFIKYYKFIILELEALVAGIDYEVEQKTYPDNLIFLAEFAGFKLVDHKRIYPTIGHDDMDAGTHVFAFMKRGK